ncbi:hypothetical protein B0H17DRAFT_1129485 [Mycena rosella]|uniref:Uncharacterized protein n=1 Tax=Mycena rosella TaxID=1033263 RepID=A0AAD7GN87_MYCRO|nr:hypothetical protein B0H17DRAFT_1129485 [Mycena rosella]
MSIRGRQDAAGALSVHKTKAELLRGSDIDWANATTADTQKHLYAKGFVNVPEIADAAASVFVVDACRVVGTLLELRRVDGLIDRLADEVEGLKRAMEDAAAHTAVEADGEAHMQMAAEVLMRTLEEQRGELETLMERLGEGITGLTERATPARLPRQHLRR